MALVCAEGMPVVEVAGAASVERLALAHGWVLMAEASDDLVDELRVRGVVGVHGDGDGEYRVYTMAQGRQEA